MRYFSNCQILPLWATIAQLKNIYNHRWISFIQVFVNGNIHMINVYLIQKILNCQKIDTFDLKSLKKSGLFEVSELLSVRKMCTFEIIPQDFDKAWIHFAIDIQIKDTLKNIFHP